MKETQNTVSTSTLLTRKPSYLLLPPFSHPYTHRYGSWRWTGAKQKRPLASIVLEPSVKEMLLNDCRDFLLSEDWSVPDLQAHTHGPILTWLKVCRPWYTLPPGLFACECFLATLTEGGHFTLFRLAWCTRERQDFPQ